LFIAIAAEDPRNSLNYVSANNDYQTVIDSKTLTSARAAMRAGLRDAPEKWRGTKRGGDHE